MGGILWGSIFVYFVVSSYPWKITDFNYKAKYN